MPESRTPTVESEESEIVYAELPDHEDKLRELRE